MIPNCKRPRSRSRRHGSHAPRPRPGPCAGWSGWCARSARISRCSRGNRRPVPGCAGNPGPAAGTRGLVRRRGRCKSRRSCGESQTCRACRSTGGTGGEPEASRSSGFDRPLGTRPIEPSQIRMIEKSKLFRTLATTSAPGNSPRPRSIAHGRIGRVRFRTAEAANDRGRSRTWRRWNVSRPQWAIRTGTVACDRMWLVGPPKIIWRRRLWV